VQTAYPAWGNTSRNAMIKSLGRGRDYGDIERQSLRFSFWIVLFAQANPAVLDHFLTEFGDSAKYVPALAGSAGVVWQRPFGLLSATRAIADSWRDCGRVLGPCKRCLGGPARQRPLSWPIFLPGAKEATGFLVVGSIPTGYRRRYLNYVRWWPTNWATSFAISTAWRWSEAVAEALAEITGPNALLSPISAMSSGRADLVASDYRRTC